MAVRVLEVIVVGSKQANIRPAQMNENPVKRDLSEKPDLGEFVAFETHLDRDPDLARHKGGPLEWQPILYACFSRFLRTDKQRADEIVLIVKHLLSEHHADPNSHYFVEMDLHKQIQTPLYGA